MDLSWFYNELNSLFYIELYNNYKSIFITWLYFLVCELFVSAYFLFPFENNVSNNCPHNDQRANSYGYDRPGRECRFWVIISRLLIKWENMCDSLLVKNWQVFAVADNLIISIDESKVHSKILYNCPICHINHT